MIKMRSDDFKMNMLSSLTSIFLFCYFAAILESHFKLVYGVVWRLNSNVGIFFYNIIGLLPFITVLGGLIFGFFADKFNPKLIFSLTSLFLACTSILALIAELHIIDQETSIVVLLFAFIATIMMMGAEIAISTAFIFNYSPTSKQGLYTSLIPLAVISVTLLIFGMRPFMVFIQSSFLTVWYFSFVFAITCLLSIIIFIIRLYFSKPNLPINSQKKKSQNGSFFKFIHVVLFSQITVIFILYWQYLNEVMRFLMIHEPMNGSLYLAALKYGAIVLFAVMLPIWGKISDKKNPYTVFTIGLFGSLLLIAPSYWCLSNIDHSAKLILPILWFGVFSSALIAPIAILILELVSSKMRSMTASALTLGIVFLPYFMYSNGYRMFYNFYFNNYVVIIIISMVSLALAFIALNLSKRLKSQQSSYKVFE